MMIKLIVFLHLFYSLSTISGYRKLPFAKLPALIVKNDFTSKNFEHSLLSTEQSRTSETPLNTPYCICPQCKSAYFLKEKHLAEAYSRSRNVALIMRCSLCSKEWFQDLSRISVANDSMIFQDIDEDQQNEIRAKLMTVPYLRGSPVPPKYSLFVSNIPSEYTRIDFAELFAEYGILNAFLVCDYQQQSRGFGFVHVSPLFPFRLNYFSFHVSSV
jgi:DNA-directed RNA polymerase subunit RPC12/RpoP